MNEKRGRNFTERDKIVMLRILDKYMKIIENKSTNSASVSMKNRTWQKITNEFNVEGEEPRTQKQLQTLFLNLKRTTKKEVAGINIQDYIAKRIGVPIKGSGVVLNELQKQQNEINMTVGNSYKPGITEVGVKMMEILGHQTKPVSNICDSATSYYAGCHRPPSPHSNGSQFLWHSPEAEVKIEMTPEVFFLESEPAAKSSTASNQASLEPESQPCDEILGPSLSSSSLRSKIAQRWQAKRNTNLKYNNIKIDTLRTKYYKLKVEAAFVEKQTKLIEKQTKLLEKRSALMENRTKLLENRTKQAELDLALKKIEHYEVMMQRDKFELIDRQ